MNTEVQVINEIMSIKEVCQYLQICRNTLNKQSIPRIHIGRRILYQKSDVINFLIETTKRGEK